MRKEMNINIITSEEYKTYMQALCRLACEYVSEIRVQFAEKAYDMYQNETVRRIVLEYGNEAVKLDENRFRDFKHVAEYGDSGYGLKDTCLSNAKHYAKTIYMLFDIKFSST